MLQCNMNKKEDRCAFTESPFWADCKICDGYKEGCNAYCPNWRFYEDDPY